VCKYFYRAGGLHGFEIKREKTPHRVGRNACDETMVKALQLAAIMCWDAHIFNCHGAAHLPNENLSKRAKNKLKYLT